MREAASRQFELPLDFRRPLGATQECISLGTKLIAYTLKRSRRRRGSFSLAIDDGGLRIGVPWNASQRWIESVLRKHEAWIVRKLAEWEQRRPPTCAWKEGAALMLLGTPLRLTFMRGLAAPMKDDGRLLIDVPPAWSAADIARAVSAWLRDEALACFRLRIAHYAPQLRVAAREVRLSAARTRWGSCHPDGRILLNWRLIQMPLRLIDYVVVHELAHLREMNHSPRFWRTVAEAIPDHKARRKEMRDEAHRYLLA